MSTRLASREFFLGYCYGCFFVFPSSFSFFPVPSLSLFLPIFWCPFFHPWASFYFFHSSSLWKIIEACFSRWASLILFSLSLFITRFSFLFLSRPCVALLSTSSPSLGLCFSRSIPSNYDSLSRRKPNGCVNTTREKKWHHHCSRTYPSDDHFLRRSLIAGATMSIDHWYCVDFDEYGRSK